MASIRPEDRPHIVHYRESRDELQWDEEYPTKAEADRRAYEVYIQGGIAVVVAAPLPPEEDYPLPIITADPENPDAF